MWEKLRKILEEGLLKPKTTMQNIVLKDLDQLSFSEVVQFWGPTNKV